MTKLLAPLLALACSAWASTQEFHLGAPVSDFTVYDLDGRSHNFSELKGDVTVVVFISVQCPVSNAYNGRMEALYNEFSSRGVKFVFLNANATEPPESVRDHAKRAGFTFPVYKDVNNVAADKFGAESTPETYVIDASGVLRYHGYIDNSQNPARITKLGLRPAIEAVLARKTVETPETKAFGCTIRRVRRVGFE